MKLIDPLAGTDERRWLAADGPASWPALDPQRFSGRRVAVLAAHPDDEVLGIGGLLALLADNDARICMIWATDGEASHPRSQASVVSGLAKIRRAESERAGRLLGVRSATHVHLAFEDSALAGHEAELTSSVSRLVDQADVVFAPWDGDGHPDHEACGRAARKSGLPVLQYPVWAWHWAVPGDPRIPWDLARRIDLSTQVLARKLAAIRAFRSQIAAIGPHPDDEPVLPDQVLAHFRRNYEVVFDEPAG